jgi:two-component system, OmpR family, phosphate regulon sensor histidine kinase PhoR
VRSRFLGKLFAGHALVVLLGGVLVGVFAYRWTEESERGAIAESLAAQAALLADDVAPALRAAGGEGFDAAAFEARVAALGTATGTRLTVIAPDGRVLGDSAEEPARMENHGHRPEVLAALKVGRGSDERRSATTKLTTLYVAVAVPGGPSPLGVARAALPLPVLERQFARLRDGVVAGVAAGSVLALLVAAFVARRLTRPLASMTGAAVAIAAGEEPPAITHSSSDEMGDLARAFNRMAAQLRERLALLEQEREKLETVFESMTEGVVAVDQDERLLHLNQAAREMLGIAPVAPRGRALAEVIRQPELIEVLRAAAHARSEQVEDVRLHAGGRDRVLAIHAVPLGSRGAVAVVLDVTALRRLETVRRDFVANVSHEIKTPLAAMLGLVETLIDDEEMTPDVRARFLGKLRDHVHRLAELATDLLHLSRAETEPITVREAVDVDGACAAAVDRFAAAARAKGVAISHEPSANGRRLECHCDPTALVQILDNLVDNAVKYTPAGGRVELRTGRRDGRIAFEVSDTGIGIEPSEQARVFERFYRVDKARSRDVPGTGLGLSIVKHLVEAHGGAVELESWPGRGSTFRVLLPPPPAATT